MNPLTGVRTREETAAALTLRVAKLESDEDGAAHLLKCIACGATSGTNEDIATEFTTGDFALSAVVSDTLYQQLPPAVHAEELPGHGRKLLIFSDNRQDAGRFAPYLQYTSQDLLMRWAIYQALQESRQGLSLEELAVQSLKLMNNGVSLRSEAGDPIEHPNDKRNFLSGKILAEFCLPTGRRVSLETLGLAKVLLDPSRWSSVVGKAAEILPVKIQDHTEAVLEVLLETVRRQRCISMPGALDATSEYIWGEFYAQKERTILREKPLGAKPLPVAWLPSISEKTGTPRQNRRSRLLIRNKIEWEEASRLLSKLFDLLIEQKILIDSGKGSFVINSPLFHFVSGVSFPLYRCEKCGRREFFNVGNICSGFTCGGLLREMTAEERKKDLAESHFAQLYQRPHYHSLICREHTAAIANSRKIELEKGFKSGEVNILSCTTTMELGVDIGDLEAVVSRNIPPGIQNYQQRTGRAGRRAQAAPICVTFARTGNFDQAVYGAVEDYLSEPPPTPFVNLHNVRLFRRHQFAILLSNWMRYRGIGVDGSSPDLKAFFGESFCEDEERAYLSALRQWLGCDSAISAVQEALLLGKGLPDELQATETELGREFLDRMEEVGAWHGERWRSYKKEYDAACVRVQSDMSNAAHAQFTAWRGRLNRWLDQLIINQFPRLGLLPTYSFPVDSVQFEVLEPIKNGKTIMPWQRDIQLVRDARLGISEYAPGAHVVADGREYISYAIGEYPKHFMAQEYYRVCTCCDHVQTDEKKEQFGGNCPKCERPVLQSEIRSFIEPKSFLTQASQFKGSFPRLVWRRAPRADEARLLTSASDEAFSKRPTDMPGISWAYLTASRAEGKLFIVNRGKKWGFLKCTCGYSRPIQSQKEYNIIVSKGGLKEKHARPNDRDGGATCSHDPVGPIDLGHQFATDVLQIRLDSQQLPALPNGTGVVTDDFARTLAEAIRFGAARYLLRIQARELQVSIRRRAEGLPEIVLYDAVPGGAGYCRQIYEGSVRDLVESARKVLDCPGKCTTSCRQCLNDYSNQFLWERFDRRPVLEWLRNLGQGVQ